MKLLDRYVIRQLAFHFLMIVTALTALYLLVDLFERLDTFQKKGLPAALAGRYFLMKLPMILDQIGPVSLLLAGIITLGLLINRRELQSLNAAGISTRRVLVPFGLGALLCTGLGLAAGQWLLPASGLEANRIWRQEVMGQRGVGTVRDGVTFYRGRQGVYTFTDQGGDHQNLTDFRYQELGRTNGARITLYAKNATYEQGHWRLTDGQLLNGDGQGSVEPFATKTMTLPEGPTPFFAPVALDFEQPLLALAQRAMDHELPGHRQAVIDVNRRLSFLLLGLPLLCLALPVILSFEMGRHGINLAFAVPVSTGLAFLVWGLWSGMQAMAQTAALSAVVASWSIHGLCAVGGLVILSRRA